MLLAERGYKAMRAHLVRDGCGAETGEAAPPSADAEDDAERRGRVAAVSGGAADASVVIFADRRMVVDDIHRRRCSLVHRVAIGPTKKQH